MEVGNRPSLHVPLTDTQIKYPFCFIFFPLYFENYNKPKKKGRFIKTFIARVHLVRCILKGTRPKDAAPGHQGRRRTGLYEALNLFWVLNRAPPAPSAPTPRHPTPLSLSPGSHAEMLGVLQSQMRNFEDGSLLCKRSWQSEPKIRTIQCQHEEPGGLFLQNLRNRYFFLSCADQPDVSWHRAKNDRI